MKSIRYLGVVLLMVGSYDLYAPEAFEPVHIFEEGGSGILVGDKVVDRMEFTDAQLDAIRKGDMPLDEQVSVLQELQQKPELNLQNVALIENGSGMPIDQQVSLLQQSSAGSFNDQGTVVTPVVDPLVQSSDKTTFDPERIDTDIAAVEVADDQKSSSALSAENAEKMIKDAARLEDDLTEAVQHMAELQNPTWIEKVKNAFAKAKSAITNFVKSVIGSGKADKAIQDVSQINARLESFGDSDPSLEALFSDDRDISAVPNQIAGSLEFLDDATDRADDVEALQDERDAAVEKVDEYVQAAGKAIDAIAQTAQQSNPDYGARVRQELTQQTVVLKQESASSLMKNIKDANSPNKIANRTKWLKELQSKDPKILTSQERSDLVKLERDDMSFKTALDALVGVEKLAQITPEQKATLQAFGTKMITADNFTANFEQDAAYKIGKKLTGSNGDRAKSDHVRHYINITDPENFYRQLTMSYSGGNLFDAVVASQNNFTLLTQDQITQVGQAFVDYANKALGQGKPFRELPRQVQEIYLKSIGAVSPDADVATLLNPLVARAETHSLMQDALSGKNIAPLSDGVKSDLNAATVAYRNALMQ